MRKIVGSLVLVATLWPARQATAAQVLEGVWELTSVSPVAGMDSDPGGIPNRKEFYASDGRLYILDPWEKELKREHSLPYKVVGSRRIISLPDGEKEETEFEISGGTLLLKLSPTETWSYRRLGGKEAVSQELEPRSLLVIAAENPATQAKFDETAYDRSDYSALSLRDRLQGWWEMNTVSGVPAADRPPYGFLNLKFLFHEMRLCALAPDDIAIDAQACRECKLEGNSLSCGTEETGGSVFSVEFNRWGHLVMHEGPVTTTLRLLRRDTSVVPRLPAKVVVYVE